MDEKRGILNFFKKLIKKELNDNLADNIDKELSINENSKDNIEIQSINSFDSIKNEITEEYNRFQNEPYDNENIVEKDESTQISYKEESNSNDNSNLERVNNMIGIRDVGQSPCEITNNLKQTILKVNKNLINIDQLDNLGVAINLGRIENYEVLDVTFKYNHEISNPCGTGTVTGEALLKAVVLVGTVQYSWILYDKLTNKHVYDGESDAITAYSVYDIVKFEENVRPTEVTAKFTIDPLRRVEVIDDENLDFYLFKVGGIVDIIGV
jgi:hypothetical protein